MDRPGGESRPAPLADRFGRVHDYLRVSLTDRCNFRCVYCVPPEGLRFSRREEILSFEEIVRVVRVGAEMGIRRIRLTGGEPTIRRDVPDLVAALREVRGIESVGLTTNGSRLEALAGPLALAGLSGVNVSCDSLRPERFRQVTRGGDLPSVLRGIAAAKAEGLPVKVNTVALRGLEQDEVEEFSAWSRGEDLEIRFIEFMPLCGSGYDPALFLPIGGIRRCFLERGDLVPLGRIGVAETYSFAGGRGRVGFIGSMTEPFCSACSRLRLTASGEARPCLFSPWGVDLKPSLRGGGGDAALAEGLRRAVAGKPRAHGGDGPIPAGTRAAPALIRLVGG